MAKKQISNYKFFPGAIPPAYGEYPNTVALLLANKTFLIEEMDQYIRNQIAANVSPFNGYTYDTTRSTKCKRDTGYIIDSLIYDLTYGGNSSTYQTAARYYINGVIQILTPAVEVATHTWLLDKITTNILTNTAYTRLNSTVTQTIISGGTAESDGIDQVDTLFSYVIDTINTGTTALPTPVAPDSQGGNLLPNAVALLNANKRFIQEETISYIAYCVANNIEPFVYYTYNAEKCRRDVSYVIEGYISDLQHGGNRQTVFNANKYYENGVPQIDGDRLPEVAAHTFIRDLVDNYIWANVAFTARQTAISQTFDNANVPEEVANTRLKELSNALIDVIQYGITYLPTVVSNRGYIKIPGFYKLKDFLLITNATRNVILYNFADEDAAAEVTYSENYDSDFPGALYGNEKITTITVDIDTRDMMVTDNIQIFVEGKEQAVRMNEAGRDAMERMKVGIPQSMLDADFEYGLQPTKWQAIALMKNYPAIYEIPGSDIAVTNVVTDASTGTGGTGASKITVTTLSVHGLAVGNAITIKALANSVSGFSRAEGSFLIAGVDSTTTFYYYAKSKVGTNNGDVLSSTYTQLRKGAFYTGAGISSPVFNVISSGSSGTITTSLATAVGRDIIGFTGTQPPVGAPLSGTGIPSGAQVTAVAGPGGTAASTKLTTAAAIGDTVLTVDSTTGISPGLVFDRGDGYAVTVTDVTGNDVTISSGLTAAIVGSTASYTGLSQFSTTGTGSGALFTVSRNGSSYSVTATTPGSGYTASDTIVIRGTSLGGTHPTNTATITVASSSDENTVATFNPATLLGGTGYSTTSGLATTVSPSGGTGLTVDVTASAGVIITVSVNQPGAGYSVGDVITLGTSFGHVLTTSSLAPGSGYTTANGVATTGGLGSGLTVDIVDNGSGGISSITIANPGSGYAVSDSITISGGNGDATFTVASVSTAGTIEVATVNTGGVIQSVTISGTPITAPTKNFISAFTMSDVTTAEIATGNTGITYSAIPTIEVSFPSPHGLVPGNTITVSISSADTGAQLAAGPFFVEQVPTTTTLRYTARSAGTIANTLTGNVYARPDSFFVHRPFDGGVQLGTGSSSHGASAIRMSKKYIRYQSGKGVMYNTGALFAPSYDIRSLSATGTAVGSVITLTTDDTDHGCQVGSIITISGVTTSGYNGNYTVTDVSTERILSVLATQVLGSTTAVLGSPCQMAVRNWHGSTVRAGIFDEQNGMFWQYDGIRMAVVRRSSTFQIAGTISINTNSNLITGSNTRFTQQLAAGDRIVIRGMTHIVGQVTSNTSMTVTPDYRGVSNISDVKICKTVDLIVPQEQWNLDPCNGTGPSGYNLDPTKMQMIGIQHTWYGAGFIDFMLRGPEGNYIWCHRFRNSNVNTEAYMRTGNQPVRYEVVNEGARDKLSAAMTDVQTTIPLLNTFYFPNSGTVMIDGELIRYTGRTDTALTGCTRSASLTQFTAGSQRNFTGTSATAHSQYAGVVLVSNTVTPNISHWGSAFMIDGQFDSDRGYIFNYAATGVSATVDKATAFLIRLAPSVSNAQIGDLGEKELLNRAQMLLGSISVTSDTVSGGGAIVIEGVLNPSNYPEDPTKITWTGLSSAAAGGQPSFAQIASGGSVSWGGSTYTTTATVNGAFTTTLTAKSFAAASNNLTATGFATINRTLTAPAITAAQNATYQFAFSTSRTDFLIAQATFTTLNNTTTLTVGDTLSVATYITGGQKIASITQNYIIIGSTPYCRIVMTAVANATSPTNTAVSTINLQSVHSVTYSSSLSTARTDFLIPNTQTSGIAVTDVLSVATYLTGGQTISSITSAYTTMNGTSYARIVMSSAANATTTAGSGGNATVVATSAATATYGSALSTARTDFLITDTAYATSGIAVGDTLSLSTSATLSSVQITGTGGQFSCTSTYLATGMTVTISGTAGGTGSITGYSNPTTYYIITTNGSTTFTLSASRGGSAITTTSGTPTGLTYTTGAFVTGQSISSITTGYITISSVSYTRIVMSSAANLTSTSGGSNDITVTLTAAGSAASYVTKNYLFFDSTSWLASGAAIGTKVASDQTKFPAGTSVAAISTRTFGATTVYRVTLTQTSNATYNSSDTLKFQFGAPYALPGEQVFSFIANPGNTERLDLTELKELTATAIGGRGAFPNGPDVLAINVYKVSGSATPANIILRWGEAQA